MRPPRITPHPNEKALQAACMKRLRDGHNGEGYHPIGTGASKAGTPDVLGCVPTGDHGGRFIAVELKQPGKVPTPLQFRRLRTYQDAGAIAGWATTEAEFDALLSHASDPYWINPDLSSPGDTVGPR